MTDSAALPPEFLLRYGDCVVLEVAGIEGCEFGGLLGSEDSRASSEKFVVGTQSQSSLVSSNRRSSYLLPVSKKSEHEEADARYLGVSAIKEYNGQKKLPDHFFMQNVFQIAYGVGFEAPGQFVRYGSHIRLVLKSTKEFLHANRQSDLLELTSSRSEVTHLKECTFKIFPRYQVRTDGEYVYYKDLIVLQDLLGRDVYCTSAKTVTLNSNPQQKTGFKLVKFLSYELATNPYLTGGSTVQLYHKEESCFIIASNMKDGAVNIDVYNSDTTLLESSSSYWQIETLPRSHREAAVTGVLHHGTPCRLRHIILELYLVIKNGDMALSKEVGAEADFELLLNFDDSDSSQDILSNVPLAIGSPLRLRNKASGLYVSIDKDIKEEKKFASCSHTDSHKDVFMLLAAPDQLLDAVVQVKKFKHGFSSIVSRLRLPGLTKVEFSSLVSKAIHHLEVLLKGGNVLGQLISSDEESSVTKTSYDICNELGLTTVLLDVADCGICALEGSHDSGEDTMQESTLARAAYAVLAKMVSKNVGSVYAVVKYGGVSKMISHLIKLGSSANWTPPLLELVDTLYSVNGPELHNYLNVLTPHDIEILLDAVYHRLFVGDVPDEYFYRLLARICKPGNGLITTTKGVDFVNRNMQLLVCQHVLGSPLCDHHKSPFWSLMTYRTVLHQVAPNRQPEVLISTSNAGQFRPMGLSGKRYPIPRPQQVSVSDCSEDDWEDCVGIRNQLLQTNMLHLVVTLDDVEHPLYQEFDRLSVHVNYLQQSIHWMRLEELTEQEIGFYCATLQLLASLCAGRNMWTQRLVRQLLPLDHILLVLDSSLSQLMEHKQMDHKLVEVHSLMLSVLYYCYIDSAYVPLAPLSALYTAADYAHLETYEAGSWSDIFIQECYLKLFSLFSQEDDFLIRISSDMDFEDLAAVLASSLVDDGTKGKNRHLDSGYTSDLKDLAKSVHDMLVRKASGESIDLNQLKESLNLIYRSKKRTIEARSVHCLEQRALLMKIVLYFLNTQATILWRDYILTPYLDFTGPKNHVVYDRSTERHHDHPKNIGAYHSPLSSSIRAIKNTVSYMENMFAVIQNLMLRKFFAPSYNAYPEVKFVDSENSRQPLQGTPTSGGKQRHQYFYSAFNKRLYELAPFVTNAGEIVMEMRCRSHDAAVKKEEALHRTLEGDLHRVKLVMECALKVLQEWPARLVNPKYKLDEDDKLVDDYFKRQFGYITDGYGIVQGTIRLKLQCCKILSASLDLIHAASASELQQAFSTIFAPVARLKMVSLSFGGNKCNLSEGDEAQLLDATSGTGVGELQQNRTTLTAEEERSFRMQTWSILHEKLERNPDMIWHTTKLFRDDTMRILLRLVYDNSEALRGEVLNLTYRLGARRAELSNLMMKNFTISSMEDPIICKFLARRKFDLTQALARFDMHSYNGTVLSLEDDIRDQILRGYFLKLRLLLFCIPQKDNYVGLVNFVFLTDFLDMNSTQEAVDGTLQIEPHQLSNINLSRKFEKPAPRKLVHNFSSMFLPHHIDLHSSLDMICEGSPNAHYQKLLIDMGFHTAIITFITSNGERLMSENVEFRPEHDDIGMFSGLFAGAEEDGNKSKIVNVLSEVLRDCCVFLRAMMMQNPYAAGAIGSKSLVRTLLNLRLVFPDGMHLITDLLRTEPYVANNITDNQFATLIRDIKEAVLYPERLKRSVFGKLNASKCTDILILVQQVILAEITVSSHRLNMLVAAFSDFIGGNNDLFINRVLNLGLGLQPDAGPYDPKSYDIKYTCWIYHSDTGRMTFSRLPKDIIADAPLEGEVYSKLKAALKNWKLLSDGSAFKVHLSVIFLIGSCVQYSTSLQQMCKRYFPNPILIFQALMIDKVEIRMPYLRLLHGLWLSDRQDRSIRTPDELLHAEYRAYMSALLTSIIRDVRLYMQLLQDYDVELANVDQQRLLGMLPKQMILLEAYIHRAVMPFCSALLMSKLHHALDEVSERRSKQNRGIDIGEPSMPSCSSLVLTLHALLAELYLLKKNALFKSVDDLMVLSSIFNSLNSSSQPKNPMVWRAGKQLARESSHMGMVVSLRHSMYFGRTDEEEDINKLKKHCLMEFIAEVDRFALKNGYADVEYLMTTPGPEKIFIGDRELSIPSQVSLDPAQIASVIGYSTFEIISNPLNCESFRFLQAEITNIIIAYAQVEFGQRFEAIRKEIRSMPSPPLQDRTVQLAFSSIKSEPMDKLKEEYSRLRYLQSGIYRSSSFSRKDKAIEMRRESIVEQFSDAQFRRWSKHGGLLIELIMQHLMCTLQRFETKEQPSSVSYTLNDICKCNEYWTNLIVKGVLRSRMSDIYELYCDQTETQLALQSIEQERLKLFQNVFDSFGAVSVVVKQLSLAPVMLERCLTKESVRIVQRMAINFGTAINETGNTKIQSAMIDCAHAEYQMSMSLGRDNSLFQVIRGLLQHYSTLFQHKNGLTPESTADAVKLLRFLSLLCEGHNEKAQKYLSDHRVVVEVANFVSDMNKMLAHLMSQALITNEEFSSKHLPKILNVSRPIIKWISPLPSFQKGTTIEQDEAERRQEYRLVDLEKLTLLSEVITQGMQALAEFCQGPRPDIQLIVARAAATREFKTFFEFFGAYHLHTRYKDPSYKPKQQRQKFSNLYRNSVKNVLTHQSVLDAPPDKIMWYGHDPLVVNLLVQYSNEKSVDNSSLNLMLNLTDITGQAAKGFEQLQVLFGTKKPTGSSKVHAEGYEDVRVADDSHEFSSVKFWTRQKDDLIRFRQIKEKSMDHAENNCYDQICDFEEVLLGLESSCLKLACSLLEGSVLDDVFEIPKIVVNDISQENLVCNMSNFWSRYLSYNPILEGANMDSCFERNMAYSYYALVGRILDLRFDVQLQELMDAWLEESNIIVDDHIARIEVRTADPSALAVAYFPVPTLVKRYWHRGDIIQLRDEIIYPSSTGTRDSADEKVKNYLQDLRNLIATLRHLESLDEIYAPKSRLLEVIVVMAHNINRWTQLTFCTTVALNILLLITVKTSASTRRDEDMPRMYQIAIFAIGFIHICLVAISTMSYVIMYGWLHVKMGLRDNPESAFTVKGYSYSRFFHALNQYGILGVNQTQLIGNSVTIKLWAVTAGCYYFFSQHDTWYYLAFLAFSLAGNIVNPLFFACSLMAVMRMSKLMQYVTKAFTANIDQVIATLLLAVIFMYLFTVLAISDRRLHNRYYFDAQGEDGCYSLQSCFRMHLDFGLLQSVAWKYPSEIETVQGEIFNFGFTFIMQIVIPGLISGIIIDTFSEMRGSKEAVEEDIANTCFVCNIDREDFETSNVDFEDHIKNDHNMWKYAWFMIYLDEKDKTEFDGIEDFCFDILSRKDGSTRWLPLKMARALSQMRDKYDLFTIYKKITSLQASLEDVEASVKADSTSTSKDLRDAIKNDTSSLEKTLITAIKRLEKKVGQAGHANSPRAPLHAASADTPLDVLATPSAPARRPGRATHQSV